MYLSNYKINDGSIIVTCMWIHLHQMAVSLFKYKSFLAYFDFSIENNNYTNNKLMMRIQLLPVLLTIIRINYNNNNV